MDVYSNLFMLINVKKNKFHGIFFFNFTAMLVFFIRNLIVDFFLDTVLKISCVTQNKAIYISPNFMLWCEGKSPI